MRLTRRALASLAASVAAVALSNVSASAEDKVVRIGYQKYGNVVLLKGKGTLEPRLAALGYKVAWTEFAFGPPLLEAINIGAIDFGHTGESPPIFAQAAGASIVYVAHEPPAPRGEAILVPKDSPIKTVADLKGKKVAVGKGSNAHYLLVKSLEKAGVAYADIQPTYLAPADARAAFETGKVDAWSIWDPYQASIEAATGARTVANGEGVVSNHQFYLASKKFAEENPKVVEAIIAELRSVGEWVKADPKAAAEQLSPAVGVPAPVLEVALKRQGYGVKPLDDKVVEEQQRIAETFHGLGLVPKLVKVSDIVWRAGS